MARKDGRAASEPVAGYVDILAGPREMLNSRYAEIKSGKVKLCFRSFARQH